MSRTAKAVTCLLLAIPLVAAIGELAMAGKLTPPPPTQIIATTIDRNFLETVVGNVSCQTEFSLAISVSGTGTHYRYKFGPLGSTNPGVLTGYSAPIPKATPVSFNLSGQADGGYVLCLQGLELDRKGNIKSSQPLSQATAYYWTKDTPPVAYHVTFTGELEGSTGTEIWAIDNSGTAVGRTWVPGEGTYRAIRWTLLHGLEDISSLDASWFDLETNTFVDGYIFRGARDVNGVGQMVGNAGDGLSIRAVNYDEPAGFVLLPRLQEPPYDHAVYTVTSCNENGEVQGQIQISPYPTKTFLWSPANPHVIHVVEPESELSKIAGGIGTNTFTVQDVLPDLTIAVRLYAFQFDDRGTLSYSLLDTVNPVGYCHINDHGAFGYVTDDGIARCYKLYLPNQGRLTVRESTSALLEDPKVGPIMGRGTNNSNDFVYNLDSIPYIYRYSDNRSYRLYDLADSYTKGALFASSNGKLKSSTKGIYQAVVSDDNAAGAPVASPFDTIGGNVNYDVTTGASAGFVLTPVPKQ